MSPFEFASKLRECQSLGVMTPESLAGFWDLPVSHFLWASNAAPIQFFSLGDESGASIFLRGAQFFPGRSGAGHRIVRSHPRIFPTSDHTQSRFQILLEKTILDCLASGQGDAIIEPKISGETIRVYSHGGDLYCATDVSFDGGNPLVGVGIENSRALGIDYGHQAARLVTERYPKVERLAKLGYAPVFVLSLPETAHGSGPERADLILVDVIDPDHVFADRNEKERIADDYSLNVVPLTSRIILPDQSSDPLAFVRVCRALSRQAHQESVAGYIVKIRLDESSDQVFVKIESAAERDRSREFSLSDLSAVVDEIAGQYGDSVWADPLHAEEMILEFLGSHHPSAVGEVHDFISAWTAARTSAGMR